ncbi:MAG: acyltransferase [Legionellales bacterium]|nr:acyltransferase [Legionellales bacterium]
MQIKLALIQQKISPDFNENFTKTVKNIHEAAQKKANIVLLSELHEYPYFCQTKDEQYFKYAKPIPNQQITKIAKLAKQLKIVLIISIYERSPENKLYNTALVIEKTGGIIGKYRKVHIPSCQEYNESFYFTSGPLEFAPIKTSYGNLGILICYDQWFPEAARKLALNNADIILIPTAIGYNPQDSAQEKLKQLNAWKTIQTSHAIANGIPLASCNRIGFEPNPNNIETGIEFWGNSFICDSFGDILTTASSEETILFASIDYNKNKQITKTWPFLAERKSNYSL